MIICTTIHFVALIVFMASLTLDTLADDITIAGNLETYATLHCLGLTWHIGGDLNQNGSTMVFYRQGEGPWREALPLVRVSANLWRGSIFRLTPDQSYEVMVQLTDPDGGSEMRTVAVRTKPDPSSNHFKRNRTIHVSSGTGLGEGNAENPFHSLQEAHNIAQPGDQIIVHPGTYNQGLMIVNSGTESEPIVYRAARFGAVEIVNDSESVIEFKDCSNIVFVGFTIKALMTRAISVRNGSNITILSCTIQTAHSGIEFRSGTERYCIISDNVIEGPDGLYGGPKKGIDTQVGIWARGSHHIIAHNRIRSFGDGIKADGGSEHDIYRNDISEITDDGIEPDHSTGNVRIWGNRIRHAFVGISLAPVKPGPTYCFRNELYNLSYTPFKTNNSPENVFLFHNTIWKNGAAYTSGGGWKNITTRNNIFFGTRTIFTLHPSGLADFNFDGLGTTDVNQFIQWGYGKYHDLKRFQAATGQEMSGIFLGNNPASIFVRPVLSAVWYEMADADLRLKPTSIAIDAGVVIASINDDYIGKAPDLGAYEFGDSSYHFGPRSKPGLRLDN